MRWSQACKWSAGRVWGLKIQLKVAAVESCASKGNFWRWAERYQGSEVKGAACDWGENAEFSRRGDASCSEVPSWVTQWFSGYTSYFSVFPASRMLGESGVVLFLLEASLVQEAMLVQRHCMWKLLVVCSFLGCSFSLAEISSKASETSTPMRDSYWVSYLFFFKKSFPSSAYRKQWMQIYSPTRADMHLLLGSWAGQELWIISIWFQSFDNLQSP